jgi:3-phosphoshikimate 1-carboxyvinyltransferase
MLPVEKSPSPLWGGRGRGSEIVDPTSRISGTVRVPGDKSIAHRALILAALADGDSLISGLPASEDVRATMACLRSLGVAISPSPLWGGSGRGYKISPAPSDGGAGWGFATPHGGLDCANSGTTMRLLTGLLAGSRISATLDGDASLRRRPMARVIEPLRRMGARIDSDDGRAPLTVVGTRLQGRHHVLPVASAQVKSAILLAGLAASGPTTIVEPVPTRDHSERLLIAMGADLRVSFPPPVAGEGQGGGPIAELRPSHRALRSIDLAVPGDFSSAAFWMAAAAMRPGWSVRIQDVGLNPTRTAFLRLLEAMGAEVVAEVTSAETEPVGAVTVAGRRLHAIDIEAADVAAAIDEIPALIAVATQADGVTTINGAGELRVKESDRIAGMAEGLRRMGAAVDERPDGIRVHGPTRLHGATVSPNGDHRIAMALAIAGLVASGPTTIEDADCVAVSYPDFFVQLREVVHAS